MTRSGLSTRLLTRAQNWTQRNAATIFGRRPFVVQPTRPLVSFTFDDFPKNAWTTGGAILDRFGVRATYYTSLGLMGRDAPAGRMFDASDLEDLLKAGHEAGCHTFAHCHSWETRPADFMASVDANRAALNTLVPGAEFESFSYPISFPRPLTKIRTARQFLCCRCGGQTPNRGSVDLNLLSAYFLEKSRDDIGAVKRVIDENRRNAGWLIFATHDVSDRPSPYGCRPDFFEEIVGYAVSSESLVLPVAAALRTLSQLHN